MSRRRSQSTTLVVAHALGQVLVDRADDDLLDARRVRPAVGGGRQRVVGLELDHRPEHEPEGLDRALGERELGEELGRHPLLGLVARVEVVAERRG